MQLRMCMRAHKLGKDRQRSTSQSTAVEQPGQLTSHAGRLRERIAGSGKPRETMLLLHGLVSVQSVI